MNRAKHDLKKNGHYSFDEFADESYGALIDLETLKIQPGEIV